MNRKVCRRKRSCSNLIQCPGIWLDGLRKTTSNAGQENLSPGRDLNPGLSEQEAGARTTRQKRSLNTKNTCHVLHLRLQIDTILKIYLYSLNCPFTLLQWHYFYCCIVIRNRAFVFQELWPCIDTNMIIILSHIVSNLQPIFCRL